MVDLEWIQCSKCYRFFPATEEYFRYTSKKKNKFKCWCKKCEGEYQKDYNLRNKDKISERAKRYRQEHCEEIQERQKRYREENREKNKEYQKQYRQENKEELREKTKQYRQDHREEIRERQKRYRQEHREELQERQKRYREEHVDELSEKAKQYRQEHREEIRERKKQYYEEHVDELRAYRFNRTAKERYDNEDIEFNIISTEEFLSIYDFFDNKCAYSGEPLEKGNWSIDHIIPLDQGGVNELYNLVPCLLKYNSSKHNRDMEEWFRTMECFSEERLAKIYEWISLNKGDDNYDE